MNRKNYLLTGQKKLVSGISTHTFVRGYKTQSQMNVNTINNINLSSRGSRILRSMYGDIEKSVK